MGEARNAHIRHFHRLAAFGWHCLEQPSERLRWPSVLTEVQTCAEFFSILLNQIRLRNNTDRGGSVTASE